MTAKRLHSEIQSTGNDQWMNENDGKDNDDIMVMTMCDISSHYVSTLST